jgi:hypothetical protein
LWNCFVLFWRQRREVSRRLELGEQAAGLDDLDEFFRVGLGL